MEDLLIKSRTFADFVKFEPGTQFGNPLIFQGVGEEIQKQIRLVQAHRSCRKQSQRRAEPKAAQGRGRRRGDGESQGQWAALRSKLVQVANASHAVAWSPSSESMASVSNKLLMTSGEDSYDRIWDEFVRPVFCSKVDGVDAR